MFDSHGFFGSRVTEHRADFICPGINLVCQCKIDGSYSVFIGRERAAKYFVALAISNDKLNFPINSRSKIECTERQCSQMDDLPRLINGFVAGQQNAVIAFDLKISLDGI